MNKLTQLYVFGYTVFLTLSITSAPIQAQAQDVNPESSIQLGIASDVKITPRLGIGYNSSGAGYDGFTRFEGFVPLLQNPGQSLTFLQGQLLLDNTSNLGGTVVLGHRFYHPNAYRIFGGYLAYDQRNTGETTFHQLGIGLETLGTIWDFRLNGYVPIGNTRHVVDEQLFDTGLQLTDLFFQNHVLVQQAVRERQEVRQLEAAMTGIDVEAGARLAQWGTTGELRGYAGLYYYDAAGTEGSLGWRVRLDVRPTDTLNLGLAFQEDQLFGTNVLFNVGATWGGASAAEEGDANAVWARMGESVMRTASITVDGQTEIGEPVEELTTIQATNPLTGEPYFFQQVNLQATGGNGTAEHPFGTITEALNAAQADQIVYVQGTTTTAIPGFTIPDGVLVLSTAPVQDIDTVEFGPIPLPQSGSGTVPPIQGTVTMGNNTVLSGFAITNDQGSGIRATNINNAEIRDSQITTTAPGMAGVFIENSSGTIRLENVDISSRAGAVIDANRVNTIEVNGSNLTSRNSATNGLSLEQVNGTVQITDSTITVTNPLEQGIVVRNAIGDVTIAANAGSEISTGLARTSGVLVEDTMGSIRLSGFNISSAVGAVLQGNRINNLEIVNSSLTSVDSPDHGITFNDVSGAVTIKDSTITVTNPAQSGLSATSIQGTLSITANPGSEITTTADDVAGIVLENTTGTVTVSGLDVSSTGGSALQGTQVNDVAIANSNLTSTNSTTGGISLETVTGNVEITDSTITITDPVNDTHGISIRDVTGTVTIGANPGSEITAPNFGVELTDSPTGQFNISGVTITDAKDSGIFGQNLGGLIIQGNIIRRVTNQGIALNNVNGTVVISGNTITNTAATVVNVNNMSVFTGQGIALANTTGEVDLTISENNQIRDNFNDAILLSFSGDAVATNVTIAGNTLENNGGVSPVRGDGIAMALDNSAVVNTLLIFDNSIRANGDEGIDLRLGFLGENNAQLENGSIGNNLIEDNNQVGINVVAANGSRQQLTITQNTINTSGQQGINILAAENANQSLTLSDNEINDSRNQGIFNQAINANQELTLTHNTINSSRTQGIFTQAINANQELTFINNQINDSLAQGILVQTIGNSRTVLDFQDNTLSNSGVIDFKADAIPQGNTFCLNLKNNTSLPNLPSTGYQLNNFGTTFLVVDLANVNFNNTPSGFVTFPAAPLSNLTTLTACP